MNNMIIMICAALTTLGTAVRSLMKFLQRRNELRECSQFVQEKYRMKWANGDSTIFGLTMLYFAIIVICCDQYMKMGKLARMASHAAGTYYGVRGAGLITIILGCVVMILCNIVAYQESRYAYLAKNAIILFGSKKCIWTRDDIQKCFLFRDGKNNLVAEVHHDNLIDKFTIIENEQIIKEIFLNEYHAIEDYGRFA